MDALHTIWSYLKPLNDMFYKSPLRRIRARYHYEFAARGKLLTYDNRKRVFAEWSSIRWFIISEAIDTVYGLGTSIKRARRKEQQAIERKMQKAFINRCKNI